MIIDSIVVNSTRLSFRSMMSRVVLIVPFGDTEGYEASVHRILGEI